ncbi:MAG: WhiB family transcriptional regulator [Cellulomonadaceae bacterium]
MRLSTLLGTITQDDRPVRRVGSPYPTGPAPTTTTPGAAGSRDDDQEFLRLVDGMIPCRVEDPEIWFAEKQTDVERAKALCRQCPLLAGCLAGAIDRQEPWGVWGGEVFVEGRVVATKRGRGRPRKDSAGSAA